MHSRKTSSLLHLYGWIFLANYPNSKLFGNKELSVFVDSSDLFGQKLYDTSACCCKDLCWCMPAAHANVLEASDREIAG